MCQTVVTVREHCFLICNHVGLKLGIHVVQAGGGVVVRMVVVQAGGGVVVYMVEVG